MGKDLGSRKSWCTRNSHAEKGAGISFRWRKDGGESQEGREGNLSNSEKR